MSDNCFLILGGGGMIGFQIAERIARRLKPEKIIIASLYQHEVDAAIKALQAQFPAVNYIGFHGDIFIRSEYNRNGTLRRSELLTNPERRSELYGDLFGNPDTAYQHSQLVQLILTHQPDVIVDAINTATAISYQDVYTATKIARRDADLLQASVNRENGASWKADVGIAVEAFERLMIAQYIPQLIRHTTLLYRAMREADTRLYLKVGTTGTGGMGLNIPYTHGEDKPSAKLMSKTAMAFAHTGLLFLMARTPTGDEAGIPTIIKEIKPAAMVGWVDVAERVIRRNGRPASLFTSQVEVLDSKLALQRDENQFERQGELRVAVVDTGENGVFAKGEFETVTALRQMEFITPEEIARVAELEIRGINTGKDVIAAVDGAVMGPTYRAGYLRRQALDELRRLEREMDIPSVALGQLGPPELSKLLWEAQLLKHQYGTLAAALYDGQTGVKRDPADVADSICYYLQNNPQITALITSVGIPILTPDGKRILRGPFISIPEVVESTTIEIKTGNIGHWANKGWVDLRPENMARWQGRFAHMESTRQQVRGQGSAAVNREVYPYEKIYPGEIAGWILSNEMQAYRLMS